MPLFPLPELAPTGLYLQCMEQAVEGYCKKMSRKHGSLVPERLTKDASS